MHLSNVALALTGLLSGVVAMEIPEDHYLYGPEALANEVALPKERREPEPQTASGSCTNTATSRQCWTSGFSASTDVDTSWPNTGVTRQYNLVITNTTCNPDGNGPRLCLLYNNQYPGPTIWANWGDNLVINVKNSMKDNGTSTHWHGIRQLNTNYQDGVNGVTECPTAPNDTRTYKFQATQFGTSWYHSHFAAQYGDGLLGPIVINGPTSANYDIDLGPFPVSDWVYKTAFQLEAITNQALQNKGAPPPADNILVAGLGKSASGGGSYKKVTIQSGKKYLLRLINTSVDNQIRVSLDNHNLTIVSNDLVSTQPLGNKQWILLGIGQRYNVIFTANQATGNYWFRAEAAKDCASANSRFGRAIFSYQGAASGDPTTSAAPVPPGTCKEESSLKPSAAKNVPSAQFIAQAKNLNIDVGPSVTTNNQSIVYWTVNMSAIDIDWAKPTLQYLEHGSQNYPATYNVIEIPNGQQWTYWIMQETGGTSTKVPIPHPMHIHGHDFYILGSGSGIFNPSTQASSLTYTNPYRRDVVFMPAGGWVVVAFPTDNPGAWVMHCHIAWHISQGLGVQFLERKSEINIPSADLDRTCNNWNAYLASGPAYQKTDSGL